MCKGCYYEGILKCGLFKIRLQDAYNECLGENYIDKSWSPAIRLFERGDFLSVDEAVSKCGFFMQAAHALGV